MKREIKIFFEDFWFPSTEKAIKNCTLFRILSKRFNLRITQNPDFLIYADGRKNFLKYDCVRIFYTGENLRPNFNECDYAFSFDYPVTKRNYRLPLYKLYRDPFETVNNGNRDVNSILGEDRKFCNFLYSKKKATERIKFFQKLSQYKSVDSGGKVLNNLGYIVDNKLEFLRKYKFTIAFENSSYPGYTTEKILHAFATDSIPIYWGNPLVERDFNPKSFINCHDYGSFEEVIDKIIEIDNNDDLYRQYLNEPAFTGNVENEYVNEENILNRFEEIFNNSDIEKVARKTDILKYYKKITKSNIKKTRQKIRELISS